MVIDSCWSKRRKASGREKEGEQERTLNDGRVFRIYKKYFDETNFNTMLKRHQFSIETLHVGKLFIAAIAQRSPAS